MSGQTVCRTCLCRGDETRSLHTVLRVAGTDVQISQILEKFFQYRVEVQDGFPQDICLACTHLLTSAYTFNLVLQQSCLKLCETKIETESYDENSHEELDSDAELDVKHSTKKSFTKVEVNTLESSELFQVLYCVECRREFTSADNLLKHCNQNHKAKRKIGRDCEYCNEKFEDIRSLVIHRKFHLSVLVCKVCWHGFNTDEELNSHVCKKKSPVREEKPETHRKMSQCDQCGKSYPIGYIKLHMRIHGSETFYTCKYCPKKFKVRCTLNSHVLWNHKRTRNHKCDICGATFVTASAKSAHNRKHHLMEKKHACDSCGKKFFSKSEIRRHTLTHSGEKNFHCHHCEKSYQTRYGLNVHLRSHSMS